MNQFKYSLLPEGKNYSTDYTNLNECLNRPLDVGGCSIFVCKKGYADISVNFKHYTFKAGQLLTVFADEIVIPSKVSEDFWAFRLSLSGNFADDIFYKSTSDVYDFMYFNPILPTTREQRKLLKGWEHQIAWILKPENSNYAHKMMSNALWNFFLAAENIIVNSGVLSNQSYETSRSWVLVTKFVNMLLKHGYEERSVNFYAKELCITPYYLYKVVMKEMHISPKEMIDFYILSELKMLLSTTDLSIKEIAERLNFENPSYLNRFFKKQEGVTLTEYRRGNGQQ